MQNTDIWSISGIGAIVGGVAAAVGIVAGLAGALRRLRSRRQRRQTLYDLLGEVERQNAALVTAAVEVSRVMIESGITWTGWRILPPELEPHLRGLAEVDRALERLHARVRGMRAESSVERLRADIEQAVATLRRGVDLYTRGTWATYREAISDEYPRTFTEPDTDSGKRRYFPGASGQEPVPALHDAKAVEEVHGLTRNLDLVVRSAWFQIGDNERAGAFSAGWPRRSYEVLDGTA